MKQLIILILGLILVVQPVLAEDIAIPLAPEAPTITLELPQEPELKYLDAKPLSLEPSEPEISAMPHGQTENLGGLLIPEITAPVAEPISEVMPVAAEPKAPDFNGEPSATNETIENAVQANMSE